MKKSTRKHVTQTLRWAVFITATIAMWVSIAEAAAYNSLLLFVRTPEIAEFSTLVNSGYLFFM